jgi:phage-related holin
MNSLLFVPFGALLTYLMKAYRRSNRLQILVAILMSSLLVSFAVEFLQLHITSRFSSLADILSNITGALIGYSLNVNLGAFFIKAVKLFISSLENRIWLTIIIYGLLLIISRLWFNSLVNFGNWNSNYSLLIGNEGSGDRQWLGQVYKLIIFDRVISENTLKTLLNEENPSIKDAVCFYSFDSNSNYRDEMGNLPHLVWKGQSKNQNHNGAIMKYGQWLESEKETKYLAKALSNKSNLTIAVDFASHDLNQVGPARIVSFSEDTGNRNFTLGQSGNDLVFRLRTRMTGENGVVPEIRVPNVLNDHNRHRVIITYNGANIQLFIDYIGNVYLFSLHPKDILIRRIFDTPVAYALMKYKLLYYAIAYMPLGVIATAIIRYRKNKYFAYITSIILFTVSVSVILETILNAFDTEKFVLENVILRGVFMLVAMISIEILRGCVNYDSNNRYMPAYFLRN